MTFDLAVGIVSGVVATSIVWVSTYVFKKYIYPFSDKILYSGPDISGVWYSYHSHNSKDKPVGKVKFQQFGTEVKGKVVAIRSRESGESNKVFNFRGRLKSGQLILVYEDDRLEGYVLGAGALKLSSDGEALIGKIVYLNQDYKRVKSYNFCFRRA